jgi:outer membrane protein TolC
VEKTEWMVQGLLTPLLQGGAKVAGLGQAKENFASLRLDRRAMTRSLDQSIRAALATTSGSFDGVTYARNQADAAQENFDLVDASYTLGVASILDLLDAQQQRLTAELSPVEAIYGFLDDLVVAERALSFYPFVEPPGEVGSFISGLEAELQTAP